MKIKNLKDVETLLNVVNECKGECNSYITVWR